MNCWKNPAAIAHRLNSNATFSGDPAPQTPTAPHLLEMLAPLYAQREALHLKWERGA